MKRFMLVGLSTFIFGVALIPSAHAARPPSGDSNPSDLSNRTVNVSQVINPHP